MSCEMGKACEDGICAEFSVETAGLGLEHTCALLSNGEVRCWGAGANGRLGYGDTKDRGDAPDTVPTRLPPIDLGPERAVGLAVGYKHTCAVTESGKLYCWGYGGDGALGTGSLDDVGNDLTPALFGHVLQDVVSVAAGENFTCAILGNGDVRCWGGDEYGQLGTYLDDADPQTDAQNGATVTFDPNLSLSPQAIVAGQYHVCLWGMQGAAVCWGRGHRGQLGNAQTGQNIGDDEPVGPALALPKQTDGMTDAPVQQLALGREHTCGSFDGFGIACWGSGDRGKLGYGNTANKVQTPAMINPLGFGGGFDGLVFAGGDSSCALDFVSTWCWGANDFGKLGYGGESDWAGPSGGAGYDGSNALDAPGFKEIRPGPGGHTCALSNAGRMVCWGRGNRGQLGHGATDDLGGTPDTVPGNLDFVL